MHFTEQATHLGHAFHYDLNDDISIAARKAAAVTSFESHRKAFAGHNLDDKVKGVATVLQSLIAGCVNWFARGNVAVNGLCKFWNDCCRRALRISVRAQWACSITNEEIHSQLGVHPLTYYIPSTSPVGGTTRKNANGSPS